MIRKLFQACPTSISRCSSKGIGNARELSLLVTAAPQTATNSVRSLTPHHCASRTLHTSSPLLINERSPEAWLKYNELVFPPTDDNEPCRPAEIYHQRAHARHQHDKTLYLCRMIRGMSVDEACKQLTFKSRAAAITLKEMIEEAQDLAVKEHNVEFRSNLWVAEAFPRKAGFIKGMRKHRGMKFGVVHYRYIHIFLKLREGKPPEHYYPRKPTGHELKDEYIANLRRRRILNAL